MGVDVASRKDLALGVALVGMVLFAGLWIAERGGAPAEAEPDEEPIVVDQQTVGVIDVALDRERRAHIDLVFDRALGDDLVGETLGKPPVRLTPHTGGIWSWQAANVLRFTPTHRLAPATRYTLELLPSLLLPEETTLVGERVFEAQTDAFQVERVIAHEEPEADADHRVRLRGELRFNYPVEPRELAPRLTLADPAAPGAKEVEIELESRHGATVVGWRSAPIEKSSAERTLLLTIAADLTPAEGNVPLGVDVTNSLPLGSRDVLVVRAVRARPGEKESTLEIDFSAAVDAERVLEHLKIEPPVKVRARGSRNRVTLSGPLRPESRYTVTVAAGLVATDGATLAKEHRTEVVFEEVDYDVGLEEDLFTERSLRRPPNKWIR